MADQSVKLKIDGDASGLLSAVKSAMAQIEQESKKLKLSPEAAKAAPARSAEVSSFLKSNEQARAQVQNQRNDENNLKVTNQLLKEKSRQLDAITKSEKERSQQGKDTTGQLAQQKKLAEDILILEKQRQNVKSDIEKSAKNEVRTYKELLSNMGEGFKSGGLGGMKSVWGGMNGAEKVGFGSTAIGGILGVLGVAANYVGQRPIDIAKMQSSAISMTTGRQLGEARSGEYTYESMYGEDRSKAKEQAASSKGWKTAADIGVAALSIATVIGAAVAAPVTFGGSVLAGGAALAGLAGLKSSFMDKGMADPAKYAAYRSQREAQDFTSMLASLHEMDPYRKDAIERLKATGTRDLGMERALGLKDKGYMGKGGYLQSQMDLGFTDDLVTRASQGILSAGGSTAMGLRSGTALQAERGLGLTNANELLGQLSGTQSIPETSKKSLIEIFSRGFDGSKYAEENRKYMQAVTEQIYRGGSTSEDTAARVADLIRSGIGNATPTTRNIEASKEAFGAYSSSITSTSGFTGGVNLATAMQNPFLKQFKDPAALKYLMNLKPEEIDPTEAGFIQAAQSVIDPNTGKPYTGESAAKELKTFQKTVGKKQLGRHELEIGKRGMAGILGAQGAASQKAYVQMVEGEEMPADLAADAATVARHQMKTKETGKAGDKNIQASAINAKISLETLSGSIDKFATDAINAAKKLAGEAHAGRTAENNPKQDDKSKGFWSHSEGAEAWDYIKSKFGPKINLQGN